MQLELLHVPFTYRTSDLYVRGACIYVFCHGTVILMNKIWAQSEFCAQIKLLVGGSLDIGEEGLRVEGLSHRSSRKPVSRNSE